MCFGHKNVLTVSRCLHDRDGTLLSSKREINVLSLEGGPLGLTSSIHIKVDQPQGTNL